MNTLQRATLLLTSSCFLLFAPSCKKKSEAPPEKDQEYLQEEGTVFRDGFMEQTIPGMTRGTNEASHLHADCKGFLPEEPTSEVVFTEDVPMRIHVTADDDLVLAIQSDQKVYCNDDFDGHQPSIARTWKKGKYKIFVGTKERTEEDLLYELNFDHYDPNAPLHATPAEPEEPEDPLDRDFHLPKLERPTAVMRLSRGTLPVNIEGTSSFGVTPYVPNGIARHDFELDRNDLKTRKDLLEHDTCRVLLDRSTPDYIVDLWADGDINFALQSFVPMGLVLAHESDRIYCATGTPDQPAALRLENAKAGKYALYMTLIPEGEAPADRDAPALEEKPTQKNDAAEAARKEASAVAGDVATQASKGASQKVTHIRGRLHIY